MVNLGIDFGSTYTMVSVYEGGAPITVQPNNISYSYPSIVAYDTKKGKYFFGSSAKDKLGKIGVRGFRGFKMLLNQQMNPKALCERGYDDVNTPEYITELFLRHVIKNTLTKLKEEKAGMLVLGAPECWFQSLETVDARSTLIDICSKMKDMAENVKIISEPTNAAAFCVWNYEKERGIPFEGSILVVDYGGGTLDIAKVSVEHINNKLQIKSELRGGAGENKDKEIGKAGIAYQEAVVKKAICDQTGVILNKIKYGAEFDSAIKSFENTLVNDAQDISDTFMDCIVDPAGLREEELTTVNYGGTEISINFAQMRETYDEVIRPELKRILDDATADIDNVENMYIALVGGFCNFCLVREQIKDYFKIGEINKDVKFIDNKEQNCETAIAHGAALFADNVIEICNVAKFGIGMYVLYGTTGEVFNKYAINCGEEYQADKVYFALDDDGKIAPMLLTHLDTFLMNFKKKSNKGINMRPKAEFAAKLNKVEHDFMVAVGFSIDSDERITVHVYNYDAENMRPEKHATASIKLSTIKGSFENTVFTNIGGNN